MNREDFSILDNNLIYFDNAATTLKPDILTNSLNDYYKNYPANIGRGYYKISGKAFEKFEECRELLSNFLGSTSKEEIIFTSGTTDGINKIVFGYFKKFLKLGDEILLTKSEHASLLLPWFELADELGLVIKYIPLTNDYKVTLENIKKVITTRTKVISIAHITNVIGDVRPIREICEFANKHNIFTLIDCAQSVGHMKINVSDLKIDFLVFSAHKMLGPTGLGVIYGKKNLLEKMSPIIFGGGMNLSFDENGQREYLKIPTLHEAGTQNIASVISFNEIIKYLNQIDINKIYKYEKELREYAIKELSKLNEVVIHNKNSESGIIAFNVKGIKAKELAKYLDQHNICVRTGRHCAKILGQVLGVEESCRVSLYFYNTKEEIDFLVLVLNYIKAIN